MIVVAQAFVISVATVAVAYALLALPGSEAASCAVRVITTSVRQLRIGVLMLLRCLMPAELHILHVSMLIGLAALVMAALFILAGAE